MMLSNAANVAPTSTAGPVTKADLDSFQDKRTRGKTSGNFQERISSIHVSFARSSLRPSPQPSMPWTMVLATGLLSQIVAGDAPQILSDKLLEGCKVSLCSRKLASFRQG